MEMKNATRGRNTGATSGRTSSPIETHAEHPQRDVTELKAQVTRLDTKIGALRYWRIGNAIAAEAQVPVGFIFNECPNDAWIEHAIGAGFNLVMPA